jgi:hypothetical protein
LEEKTKTKNKILRVEDGKAEISKGKGDSLRMMQANGHERNSLFGSNSHRKISFLLGIAEMNISR